MLTLKVKEIRSKNGDLHFIRYRLISTQWFSVYIHRIYLKDEDDHLHDHPWNFAGIILWGKYWYKAFDTRTNIMTIGVNKPLSIFHIPAEGYYHKITAVPKPVTSLVITGKRKHFWGYYVDGNFVDHKTYRKNKNR